MRISTSIKSWTSNSSLRQCIINKHCRVNKHCLKENQRVSYTNSKNYSSHRILQISNFTNDTERFIMNSKQSPSQNLGLWYQLLYFYEQVEVNCNKVKNINVVGESEETKEHKRLMWLGIKLRLQVKHDKEFHAINRDYNKMFNSHKINPANYIPKPNE